MPQLVVTQGIDQGKVFELDHDTTFVGRSRRNDIQITDPLVSGKHFKVFRIGSKFFVEDLKSTNGTRVNSRRLESGEGFELEEGDSIRLGRTILRVQALPVSALIAPAGAAQGKPASEPAQEEMAEPDRRRASDQSMRLIQSVSKLLQQSFNLQSFCSKVLELVLESLPRIDTAALVYLDPLVKRGLENRTIVSQTRPELRDRPGNRIQESLIDRMLEVRKTIQVLDAPASSEDVPSDRKSNRIRSAFCIPLISDSVLRGGLYVHSIRNPHGFRKEDLVILNVLSASLAVAFEKSLLSRRPRGPLRVPR